MVIGRNEGVADARKTPVRSREHALHLLTEAAELEHNLLCSYLYAAFSLKQGLDEDLMPHELVAVRRWHAIVMDVCMEEMTHLAQVANLTVALGSRPHFDRPNLPVDPGYHPARVQVALTPFDLETLEHFVFLERPETPSSRTLPRFDLRRPTGASQYIAQTVSARLAGLRESLAAGA